MFDDPSFIRSRGPRFDNRRRGGRLGPDFPDQHDGHFNRPERRSRWGNNEDMPNEMQEMGEEYQPTWEGNEAPTETEQMGDYVEEPRNEGEGTPVYDECPPPEEIQNDTKEFQEQVAETAAPEPAPAEEPPAENTGADVTEEVTNE